MPCPACNTKEWLFQQKEEAESCSSYSGYTCGTGVTIWENAVEVAERENPEKFSQFLKEIQKVSALYEDDQGNVLTKEFNY